MINTYTMIGFFMLLIYGAFFYSQIAADMLVKDMTGKIEKTGNQALIMIFINLAGHIAICCMFSLGLSLSLASTVMLIIVTYVCPNMFFLSSIMIRSLNKGALVMYITIFLVVLVFAKVVV